MRGLMEAITFKLTVVLFRLLERLSSHTHARNLIAGLIQLMNVRGT